MRLSSIPLLAFALAGATGCATSGARQTPVQQGYNPGQWAPLPQPGAPYGQAPYYGQAPQPSPWGAPPQPASVPWSPPAFFPVNVPALLALQGKVPCAPREVAPGTWASFDCAPFQAMTQVLQYIPMVRFNFLPSGPLPAAVDHRAEGQEGPIKDQGAVGACTAVSLSTVMENALRRQGTNDSVSALHLWSRYGVGLHGRAGDSNVGHAVASDRTWPYDPTKACKLSRAPMDTCGVAYGVSSSSEAFDPGLKAEHDRADQGGRYTLSSVEQLHAKPADPAEIAGLLSAGDDVWISFSVNDEAWTNRALSNGVIPDYETVDDKGHAVVLAGYRTLPNGTRQFLVHNSWSARWGEGGYGWISEAMVRKYTRAAYRVRVALAGGNAVPMGETPKPPLKAPAGPSACPAGQVQEPLFGSCVPAGLPGLPGLSSPDKAPSPGPAAAPQQGNCPAGQAPDLMNGQCAATCAGGTPAVGGMCLPIPGRN